MSGDADNGGGIGGAAGDGPRDRAGTTRGTRADAGADAGRDAGVESGQNPGADGGRDAGAGVGRDAGAAPGVDAGVAPGVQAGAETGTDTGTAARLQKLFEGHRLTPTQRRIAHCMVRRAADAPFLSSVELAELAGVSQPSVTRFAVALGFDGYPALRRHLREVAPTDKPDDTGSYNEYQQAVQAEIDNLRHLAAALADPSPVIEAGRLFAASRPLPVLGLRAATAQAAGFSYFARKVHPDVRLLDEGGTMLTDRIDAAVRAGASALLCFALPRHPREVVDALEYARTAGLTVVTVADSAFAPVAHHTDLLLPAPVGTGLAFDTACAPMLLGRVLLEAMCDALPDAQARLEQFDARAAARGLFVE
ncbi:MurR/RpiR family transcriptional regulator [Streptomyces sp. RPA4-5]|uniref:MurR/RpiR family transcriptional regulator n=1 Tax=Streptomyces TaxID=1883 RepID=UPI00143E4241|nr:MULTISPECIES: MurR/RpiR family transcriptional regulator [Streptomyces]MCX4640615.1 MurR/RpiR family transcriptional regulator [Streptomyces platensis]QIY55854.1 MurR/RpiR family transcriptional regulator [Streptomyces sp. RPA4-5]WJY38657.1 MurR/RpiR family transcriptional regulator [Streptomyces sp. P9-2B-2]